MSIFNPNIPQPTDKLSISQPQLLQNFSKLDTSFGTDHYPFSDLTSNNGKHNQITTPAYVANPPTGLPPVTAANEPKMYAFQDSANLGVINYSRGPSNAVPTPITKLHGGPIVLNSGGGLTNVLDFTGLTFAFCTLWFGDSVVSTVTTCGGFIIIWTGAPSNFFRNSQIIGGSAGITIVSSGNILQIKNNFISNTLNNFYWSL